MKLSALAAALLLSLPAAAADDPFAAFSPLLGRWTGEGSGQPGEGKGGFSLERELQGSVLVRKNRAEYAAHDGRPAGTHEDLLIIYRSGDKLRATYFDNEGHKIEYAVSSEGEGKRLVFLSDAAPGRPRFRLTYVFDKPGHVGIEFEIAPPGAPEVFQRHLTAAARKEE